MKLVSFEVGTPFGAVKRIGAVQGGALDDDARIVDLNSAYGILLREGGDPRWREIADASLPPEMMAFLEGGEPAMQRARSALSFAAGAKDSDQGGAQMTFGRRAIRLLAPVPRPRTMRDFTVYAEHMSTRTGSLEKPAPWYHFGVCYKGNPDRVFGPEDPLIWPDYTEKLDPELELCCVVGKAGKNIPVEDAAEYIAGYTIFVDGSARDVQAREFLGPYKSKDFGTNLGPCLVTPDEFDELNAACGIRVNGEVWWEGNTGHLRHFTHPHLVAYASDEETIHPGDVISAGTIGTSCSMDTGKWIKPGDTVEMWIEGIGTMRLQAERTPRKNSYVRDGMTGLLEVPESARSYPQQLRDGTAPPMRRI
jgi:2-keto-4-pentenoate hydratase/2-oxohepta-3-ene-1,7-dioic acid hydratase in catechol pathway